MVYPMTINGTPSSRTKTSRDNTEILSSNEKHFFIIYLSSDHETRRTAVCLSNLILHPSLLQPIYSPTSSDFEMPLFSVLVVHSVLLSTKATPEPPPKKITVNDSQLPFPRLDASAPYKMLKTDDNQMNLFHQPKPSHRSHKKTKTPMKRQYQDKSHQ